MVSSQVHSQHPSNLLSPYMSQHRSWFPINADVHFPEPETSEEFGLLNPTPDGRFLSSKGGYACPGHASITSPLSSSWIQRLIPTQNTQVEQQPSQKLSWDKCGIDGSQSAWKESADHLTVLGNQFDVPVFENSRRSKQDFFSRHKRYRETNLPVGVGNGVNIRPFEAPDARPPKIQVLPKPLPVVESLLPGRSKKVGENQTPPETNVPHVLSRCTGFGTPMKQTVHYSAYEKSRVSCTSIEAPNGCSVAGAAGDLLALKSLPQVKRGIGPSQPCAEFSFHTPNMDLTYGGKDRQAGANLRTYQSSTQTEDAFVTVHNKSRYLDSHKGWASSVRRCQSVEDRLIDGYPMPSNCWNSKKCSSYAHDGSEAPYAREGSFDGGWQSLPSKEKDELWQMANLATSQCESNAAKEKAGIDQSHQMVEQDLGSSHEEQGGTSRSFSFHLEKPDDHSKMVMRKGQWPFGASTLSNQDLCHSKCAEGNRAGVWAEATRQGCSFDNSSSFQKPGVREAGADCTGRSQPSLFFGTENLYESSSWGVLKNHDISPHKAASVDIGGVCRGQMKTEAILSNGIDHAVLTLKGRHPLSRLESNSMIEGEEGKEQTCPFSSSTARVKNWEAFKPSIQRGTPTCPREGAQANHADGNHVSLNHWQALKPLIQSTYYTCPQEGAQLNNREGKQCSIGSCSKRLSNLNSEDASTSADARSQPIALEKPMAFQKQIYSSQRPCAGPGSTIASDEQESMGTEATNSEASGSGMKQNVWIKRWSALRSRKAQAVSMPIKEGIVLASVTHARNYMGDHYLSEASRKFSHRFDFRPVKRICCETRSGLHPELGNVVAKVGSVAVGEEPHNGNAVACSHFMKRFFTPSAAAMAIMGITARKVHGTQPQKSGLFGVWASKASLSKPTRAQAEVCEKEFSSTPNCKKGISQFAAEAPPIAVDL